MSAVELRGRARRQRRQQLALRIGGDDFLDGGDGDDTLEGGSGNDTLKGGGGADVLRGNGVHPFDYGIDTVSYYESPEGVIALLGLGGAGGDAEGDTFNGIENLTGSIYADTLWGDDGINELMGMDGNDVLQGYGGDDRLHGGNGNDTLAGMDGADMLNGGAGADTMQGGTGDDTYYVDNGADDVIEVAGQGVDRVRTSTSYSLAPGSEVEMLETTDPTAATAISLGGNEYANIIIGNAGNNVIVGGAGLDTMCGGDGGDVFVWHSITEMGSTLDANSDTVRDFNAADGDLMVLSLIDADGNAGNGDTAFTFIGDASNPFTAAGQVSCCPCWHRYFHPAQHRRRRRSRWSDPGRRAGSRCELVRSLTVRALLARQRRKALGFPRIGMSPFVQVFGCRQ